MAAARRRKPKRHKSPLVAAIAAWNKLTRIEKKNRAREARAKERAQKRIDRARFLAAPGLKI